MPEDFKTRAGIRDVTYDHSGLYVVHTLHFLKKARVKVKNSATVEFQCQVLILDNDLTVDVTGEDGKPGKNGTPDKGVWYSGPQEDEGRTHQNWHNAISTPNPSEEGVDATPGTDGADGGTFIVRYAKIGKGTKLGNITSHIEGGKGGASAIGGKGQTMICGVPHHRSYEQWPRPSGKNWVGRPGKPGLVKFERAVGPKRARRKGKK